MSAAGEWPARLVVTGLLAEAPMLAVLGLSGQAVSAGTAADVAGVAVAPNDALRRYGAVMGLAPRPGAGGAILSATARYPLDLEVEIAAQIIASDAPASAVAARLAMVGAWAQARLNGRASRQSPALTPRRGPGAVAIAAQAQPYARFFAVEEYHLRHALHGGGMSAPVLRAGFVASDAACLLPYDPVRDRVLVIEQFRVAPLMRDDPQCWLLEPIAGRIDAGETPHDTARREAAEEAGLALTGPLIDGPHHYPSPGAVGEYLYLYIGLCDLPQTTSGIHGEASEDEDIRTHIIPRADLSAMVAAGQIGNGPLAMLSLWLDARADQIRRDQG